MAAAMGREREGIDLDDPWQAIEACYEQGWTDGLPVVPPTEVLVERMLASGPWDPDQVLLHEPARDRGVTAYKAAVNAVMAGCRPEYFPVIGAASPPSAIRTSSCTARPRAPAGRPSC